MLQMEKVQAVKFYTHQIQRQDSQPKMVADKYLKQILFWLMNSYMRIIIGWEQEKLENQLKTQITNTTERRKKQRLGKM